MEVSGVKSNIKFNHFHWHHQYSIELVSSFRLPSGNNAKRTKPKEGRVGRVTRMCASYVQLETQLSSLLGGQEKG